MTDPTRIKHLIAMIAAEVRTAPRRLLTRDEAKHFDVLELCADINIEALDRNDCEWLEAINKRIARMNMKTAVTEITR